MKEQRHRILCAVCALALVLTAVLAPAAWAADGAGEVQDTAKPTLTTDDAAEMQQADAAVTALTGSDEYEQMSREERLTSALAELDELARKGLVRRDSIRTDEENGIVSFTYRCGVLGGILLTEPEDETLDEENAETETASSDHALSLRLPPDLGAEMQKSRAALLRRTVLGGILLTLPDELDEMTFDAGDNGLRAPRDIAQCTPRTAEMPLTDDVRQAAEARQYRENALPEAIGRAAIYYAFDNTVNSSRFPYYSYMQGFWEGMGLRTTMNTRVTLSDLRRMNKYDLCILSAHGAYYTYSYGTFRKHTRTEPIILLTEASTLYKDIIYGFDLLAHRIIKLNGLYCVTADFFRNAYRSGQLSNTIIYSETCEFLGVTNSVDESMAEALLAGGARTVLGYVNNVYTVYSRSMLWDTINHLAMGQTIGRALAHAKDTYGENDIIWYTEQGGRRPHAAAACLVLYGDENARLNVPENFSPEERAEAAEDMLADVLESAA